MSTHIIAVLLVAWATWGIVLGWWRARADAPPPVAWIVLVTVWAVAGPLVLLMPRGRL